MGEAMNGTPLPAPANDTPPTTPASSLLDLLRAAIARPMMTNNPDGSLVIALQLGPAMADYLSLVSLCVTLDKLIEVADQWPGTPAGGLLRNIRGMVPTPAVLAAPPPAAPPPAEPISQAVEAVQEAKHALKTPNRAARRISRASSPARKPVAKGKAKSAAKAKAKR